MKKLQGQRSAISIEDAASNTEVQLGVLDSPEIAAPEQEVTELRGTGSTEWVDVQKTETAVVVSGEFMSFNLDAWDRMVDWDAGAGELDDSADVKLFLADVEYEASDGSTKVITAGPGYIDGSIPLGGDKDSYVGMDVELRCQTIKNIVNTDASTA